jgi:hypothetical protein
MELTNLTENQLNVIIASLKFWKENCKKATTSSKAIAKRVLEKVYKEISGEE